MFMKIFKFVIEHHFLPMMKLVKESCLLFLQNMLPLHVYQVYCWVAENREQNDLQIAYYTVYSASNG